MSATLSISKSYPCLILTNNKGEIYFYKTPCCGIIPKLQATKAGEWLIYADEADLLNKAVFGITAKEWREANLEQAKTGNIRDFADILQLNVLANLESLNSVMIEAGTAKERRFDLMAKTAISQYQRLAQHGASRGWRSESRARTSQRAGRTPS